MPYTPSRHPFTYSCDLIRSVAGIESRDSASRLRCALSDRLGLDDTFLAGILSEVYQVSNFSMITGRAVDVPAGTILPSHNAIVEAVMTVSPTGSDPEALASLISSSFDARAETGQNMTAHQLELLPDLVALAMAAYAILKADRNAPDMSHPAIAAFYPLVADTLEERAEVARLEARTSFDFDQVG